MSIPVVYENLVGHIYSFKTLENRDVEASFAKHCTIVAISCLIVALGLLIGGVFFVTGMPLQLTIISVATVAIAGALIFSAMALSFKKEWSKNVHIVDQFDFR
ncbi:MAG: hypothetical protein RRZ67_03430 [Victivallaceae bacterium]